ncbi:MAG: hypothetical protein HKM04_04830 [Legionellales bacterium]|nr:hypothetical protein [Legionellales bacterium]
MTTCPCCSGKTYQDCCEPYLTLNKPAPDPEALMRSRYTAHTLANVEYLKNTMKDKAAEHFDPVKTLRFAKDSEWQGLDVVRSYQPFPTTGYVEFVAHYNDAKGRHQHLHELSEFKLEDGQWYYVDGKKETAEGHHHHGAQPVRHATPKLGRNDPCSCGSGKKYKKCCG